VNISINTTQSMPERYLLSPVIHNITKRRDRISVAFYFAIFDVARISAITRLAYFYESPLIDYVKTVVVSLYDLPEVGAAIHYNAPCVGTQV